MQLLDGILHRQYRAIARAISTVESGSGQSASLMHDVFSHTGKSLIVGITGSPGAGKSTLVDRLAGHYRRQDQTVGIIAVDPSSPFSGGAILGDRIRMQALGTDPGCFIRSMATRGNLGGLARATTDAVAILDAAGFDRIIVETVGVGQDEVDIVKTADVSIVVLVPGMGDDIQTIKAGIMEIGDIFVINKADRDGVHNTEREIESLLTIVERPDGWNPPIIKTIATQNQGLDELADAITTYKQFADAHPNNARRNAIAEQRILELLGERLLEIAIERGVGKSGISHLAEQVATKERDPYSVVDEIIEKSGISKQ
jgi:LAO/AO transport system kinase